MPWFLAVVGLAIPLIAGGGAGWIYVVGWLIVLAAVAVVGPWRGVGHRDRVGAWAVACGLLVVPGFFVGGTYVLPAALISLLIELRAGSTGSREAPETSG